MKRDLMFAIGVGVLTLTSLVILMGLAIYAGVTQTIAYFNFWELGYIGNVVLMLILCALFIDGIKFVLNSIKNDINDLKELKYENNK